MSYEPAANKRARVEEDEGGSGALSSVLINAEASSSGPSSPRSLPIPPPPPPPIFTIGRTTSSTTTAHSPPPPPAYRDLLIESILRALKPFEGRTHIEIEARLCLHVENRGASLGIKGGMGGSGSGGGNRLRLPIDSPAIITAPHTTEVGVEAAYLEAIKRALLASASSSASLPSPTSSNSSAAAPSAPFASSSSSSSSSSPPPLSSSSAAAATPQLTVSTETSTSTTYSNNVRIVRNEVTGAEQYIIKRKIKSIDIVLPRTPYDLRVGVAEEQELEPDHELVVAAKGLTTSGSNGSSSSSSSSSHNDNTKKQATVTSTRRRQRKTFTAPAVRRPGTTATASLSEEIVIPPLTFDLTSVVMGSSSSVGDGGGVRDSHEVEVELFFPTLYVHFDWVHYLVYSAAALSDVVQASKEARLRGNSR